jgi:hypothetical protein
MEHAVQDPPAAVLGPRLAADIVAMVREGSEIRLDYTPASLAVVDRVIGGIRRENPPIGAVTRSLLGFGAYAGEVLVRVTGGAWVDFDTDRQDIFGQPIGIRTADGRLWNPLGKAIKRYENGPDDSLRLFYLSVVGRADV